MFRGFALLGYRSSTRILCELPLESELLIEHNFDRIGDIDIIRCSNHPSLEIPRMLYANAVYKPYFTFLRTTTEHNSVVPGTPRVEPRCVSSIHSSFLF